MQKSRLAGAAVPGAENVRADLRRILVVDDEETDRRLMGELLADLGYRVVFAPSGNEALGMLHPDIDLVLLDVLMPDMDGLDIAARMREVPYMAQVPIIMIMSRASQEDRLRAVVAGGNDFITKPIDRTELQVRMGSLLRMKAALDAVKGYQANLEEMVRVRTEALRLAVENLTVLQRDSRAAHLDTIRRLAVASEYKDEDTGEHIQRISDYSTFLSRRTGLSEAEVELYSHASSMHDVGKIGIPDGILLKPGKLDPVEWEIMQEHTTIGARILADSSSEVLKMGEIIALTHHERWDGTGYPSGLAGGKIPLAGRITAVTDVFDALTSKRPYKPAFSNQKALEIMKEGRGRHFDPWLLDLFVDGFDEILTIQHKYRRGQSR